MKRLVFLLTILCAVTPRAFTQTGYFYNNHFIELTPENDQDVTSPKLFTNKIENSTKYHSLVYKTNNNSRTTILPRIILELNDSSYINTILFNHRELSIERKNNLTYYLKCDVSTSSEVLEIIKLLSSDSNIIWCEPDMISGIDYYANNNPYYSEQFYLKNIGQLGGIPGIDINIEPVWSTTTCNSKIKIAILDSGIDLSHEDLSEAIEQGYTVENPTGYGMPQNWNEKSNKAHGTACAGIIGAINNDIGIIGVATGAKIIPVNIQPNFATELNQAGFASHSQIAEAIRWALKRADVLSCSWGSQTPSNDIASAIKEALEKGRNGKGCIIVASAGNRTKEGVIDPISFPANIDGVIAVGAVDNTGKICHYSNQGKELSVVAPSDNIFTTDISGADGYSNSNYYPFFNGTSASCPQVAGIAAIVLTANNSLYSREVKEIIQQSATDLGESGWDKIYGYGLVNAYKAYIYALAKKQMYIYGPNVIDKDGYYSIINLPSICSVDWEQTPREGALNSQYAYLTTNGKSATIKNIGSDGFSINLKATVIFPEWTGLPKRKISPISVTGDCALHGIYYEINSNGEKSMESPLNNADFEEMNTAAPGNTVIVTSDNFRNRNVTYRFSEEIYNENERPVDGDDNWISFEMPQLQDNQHMIFSVSGGNINKIHNFIFTNSNQHSFNLMINDKKIAIKLGNEITPKNKLSLSIYEASKLRGIIKKEISTDSYSVNLPSGIYIIEAQTKALHLSKTIKVK